MMKMKKGWHLLFGGIVLLSLSGCITDATTELTKAPFDATSDLTNGTSKAVGEFLQPTTELTSSSTPGATSRNDALARARKKTEFFAEHAYENLRSDISRGSGEYLVSLATLAGVPGDQFAEFRFLMQNS